MENMIPTTSELLHSYIDGELEQTLEPQLFDALNSSMDLRTEMRELLAMKRAVKNDKVAFVPPMAATAAVFGALGMSAPLAWTSAWWSALWSKAWIPALTAVMGSAITWYAVNSTETSTNSIQKSDSIASAQTSSSLTLPNQVKEVYIHDTIQIIKRVPVSTAFSREERVPNTASSSDHYHVVIEKENKSALLADNSVSEGKSKSTGGNTQVKPDDIVLQDSPVSASFAPLLVRRMNATSLTARQPNDVVNISQEVASVLSMPEPFSRKFNLQIRGISASSAVDVSIQPESGLGFNNMALAGIYNFSENFSGGVEIGREPFAMNFKGFVNGLLSKYEVNPSLLWGSAVAQFRMNPVSSLQPFAQLNAGVTNYGLMAKVLVGTYYSPISQLRFLFGVEGSVLRYEVPQTGTYYSPKYGITYGLSYQF